MVSLANPIKTTTIPEPPKRSYSSNDRVSAIKFPTKPPSSTAIKRDSNDIIRAQVKIKTEAGRKITHNNPLKIEGDLSDGNNNYSQATGKENVHTSPFYIMQNPPSKKQENGVAQKQNESEKTPKSNPQVSKNLKSAIEITNDISKVLGQTKFKLTQPQRGKSSDHVIHRANTLKIKMNEPSEHLHYTMNTGGRNRLKRSNTPIQLSSKPASKQGLSPKVNHSGKSPKLSKTPKDNRPISDFKDKQAVNAVIFSSYVSKIQGNKPFMTSVTKGKPKQNNVITGVLQYSHQIPNETGNKESDSLLPPAKEEINNSSKEKSQPRMNLHSQNARKVVVDFRKITTSPLMKTKKITVPPNEESKMQSKNIQVVSSGSVTEQPLSQEGASKNIEVATKKIKLMHEFTKTGFSGEGIKKVNQDSFFIFRNFGKSPNYIYMGVCDGHGMVGHEISGYLKENLPVILNSAIKFKDLNILTDPLEELIKDIFIDTNLKLAANEMIDSTFSGSTCVSVIYTPEKLMCANVGDSRAVLGRLSNGEWTSVNLTRDHKPVEEDEAERIKKSGGRIEPFRDEDNVFIGPPRVWLKDDDVPGLAMTRSFGDRVASTVGVISEPEFTSYKFTEEDKFLIVASDGVWEFIDSAECVNIIKDYYLNNDIVGCCEYLHKESSVRWIKEEEVIDDITMIILFLE